MTVVAAFKLDDFCRVRWLACIKRRTAMQASVPEHESDHFTLGTASITISASIASTLEGTEAGAFSRLRGVH